MLATKKNISLTRAACPEQVGIPHEAIMKVVESLEAINFEYHSLMFVRSGVVAAECYRFPFTKDTTHCMYSVSKNITATALGFAISEGKISLDSKLSDIFPDKYPKKRDEYFEDITIRNLVSMTAGKSPSYLLNKSKGDWYRHFSEAARKAKPGEKFEYVNECTYVLSACLKRVLGMGINDYLVPRLWNELGIDKPFWETDSNGIEAGGWGLQMKLEDMAKVALCYHNDGVFGGKQVVPREWALAARLNQTPVGKGEEPTKSNGYGFSIWREDETQWRFDGMYGQTANVYEEKDLICLINSGEMNPGRVIKIFNTLADCCIEPVPDAKQNDEFISFLANRPIDIIEPSILRSPLEDSVKGKVIRFAYHAAQNIAGFPLSVLPPTSIYMSKDRAGNINNVSFEFNDDGCFFTWSEGKERNTVFCPMDGTVAYTPIILAQMPFSACCSARWQSESTLEINIRPIQSVAKRTLIYKFNGSRVAMYASLSPSIAKIIDSIAGNVGDAVKNEKLRPYADSALRKLDRVFEPVSNGIMR